MHALLVVHCWKGPVVCAGAVLADVALVWDNCRAFNGEGSEMAAAAGEAEAAFTRAWQRAGLSGDAGDAATAPSGAAKGNEPEGAGRKRRRTELAGAPDASQAEEAEQDGTEGASFAGIVSGDIASCQSFLIVMDYIRRCCHYWTMYAPGTFKL